MAEFTTPNVGAAYALQARAPKNDVSLYTNLDRMKAQADALRAKKLKDDQDKQDEADAKLAEFKRAQYIDAAKIDKMYFDDVHNLFANMNAEIDKLRNKYVGRDVMKTKEFADIYNNYVPKIKQYERSSAALSKTLDLIRDKPNDYEIANNDFFNAREAGDYDSAKKSLGTPDGLYSQEMPIIQKKLKGLQKYQNQFLAATDAIQNKKDSHWYNPDTNTMQTIKSSDYTGTTPEQYATSMYMAGGELKETVDEMYKRGIAKNDPNAIKYGSPLEYALGEIFNMKAGIKKGGGTKPGPKQSEGSGDSNKVNVVVGNADINVPYLVEGAKGYETSTKSNYRGDGKKNDSFSVSKKGGVPAIKINVQTRKAIEGDSGKITDLFNGGLNVDVVDIVPLPVNKDGVVVSAKDPEKLYAKVVYKLEGVPEKTYYIPFYDIKNTYTTAIKSLSKSDPSIEEEYNKYINDHEKELVPVIPIINKNVGGHNKAKGQVSESAPKSDGKAKWKSAIRKND